MLFTCGNLFALSPAKRCTLNIGPENGLFLVLVLSALFPMSGSWLASQSCLFNDGHWYRKGPQPSNLPPSMQLGKGAPASLDTEGKGVLSVVLPRTEQGRKEISSREYGLLLRGGLGREGGQRENLYSEEGS